MDVLMGFVAFIGASLLVFGLVSAVRLPEGGAAPASHGHGHH